MDHISYTQLNMLTRCGEQYRRRYIEGEVIAPSAALVRGRSCHKANEKNFKQKIDTEIDLPEEEVVSVFADEWDSGRYNIAWTEEELGMDSPSKAEGKWKDSGVRLISAYHLEQSPLVHPAVVEDAFRVEFHGSFPALSGIMDRITKEGIIEDDKFVSKSPNISDIETDLQMTVYDLGYRTKYGKPPRGLGKRFAVDTKVAKTMCQETVPRDKAVIDRLLYRTERALDAVAKEVFLPPPSGSWWCSKRFCGYWSTCKVKP